MADEATTASTESAATATESPAEGQANESSAASEAARTLAARRAEIRGKLKGEGADPKAPKSDGSSQDPPPSSGSASTAQKTTETPRTEAKADAGSDEIAALIKEDRRIKAEAKKLAEERAQLEAARKEVDEFSPRVKAAQAALAKGSRVDAIRALFPDEDLTTDLFWDLAKQLGETDGSSTKPLPAIDPETLADLALERLEGRRKAEQEAAEAKVRQEKEAAAKELTEARGEYLEAVNTVFQANTGNYSGVVRLFKLIGDRANTVVSERVIELAEEHGRATGNVLSVAEALAKVNAELIADVTPANDNAAKPAGTVTSAWKSDPGRPAPETKEKSLDEIRAERKAALRTSR